VIPLKATDHVIVVGAGVAGWRFVESLRREGYEGALTLIGEEPHLPYDRPPLSKQVLAGKWHIDKATLASEEHLARSMASVRLGVRATRLDVDATTVELANGTSIVGTHVVLAVGARARPLAFASSGALPTLRHRDDVVHLARAFASLESGSVVAVIGGGFVGAEAATSIKARGLTPVVLEAASRPLIAVLGDEVSRWLFRLASDAGIDLRTDQVVTDVTKRHLGYDVHFADREPLAARLVVAAVGSTLDLTWLEGSGLTLDDGIVVDANLEAANRIAAIGDVARFWHTSPAGEELVRIEHWQVAIDHAAQLARHWVSGAASPPLVPYFWSDQYGKKIQLLGRAAPTDDVVRVSGSPEEGKWLALYSRSGIVTAAISLSQPRGLMLTKPLLEAPTTLHAALALAPWSA